MNTYTSVSTVDDSVAWACSFEGNVVRTTDGGTSWGAVAPPLAGVAVNVWAVNSDTALVCTWDYSKGSILRTSDGGNTWSTVYQRNSTFIDAVHMFNADSGTALADPSDGYWTLRRTTDGGLTWNPLAGTGGQLIQCMTHLDTTLVAGNLAGGVSVSVDGGEFWTAVDSGIPHPDVHALAVRGTDLFVGTTSGVARSGDHGRTWNTPRLPGVMVVSLAAGGPYLFAGTYADGVYRSSDGGLSWHPVNTGLPLLPIWSLVVKDSVILAGIGGGGVFRSIDNGGSWIAGSGLGCLPVLSLATADSDIFAGTSCGVYRSTDDGVSWNQVQTSWGSWGFWATAAKSGLLLSAERKILYRSTDRGASWTSKSFPYEIRSLLIREATVFAGTINGGVYRSTNEGVTWELLTMAMPGLSEAGWNNSFTWTDSRHGWFGTNHGVVYHTVNGGRTWQYSSTPIASSTGICFLTDQHGMIGSGLPDTRGRSNRSINGGLDWRVSASTNAAGDASIAGLNTGALSWWTASGPAISYSINQGQSWAVQHTRSALFNHISMKYLPRENKIVGWAVGFNGQISKYEGFPQSTLSRPHLVVHSPLGMVSEETVRVVNTGTLPVRVLSAVASDPRFTVFPDSGLVLPGEGMTSTVKFHATAIETVRTEIIFVSDATNSPDTLAVTGVGVTTREVMAGWNMISVPHITTTYQPGSLFPTAESGAFGYDQGFRPEIQLVNGRGYWMKFPGPGTVFLSGIPVAEETVEVGARWNIIGSLSGASPVTGITSDPPGLVLSEFLTYDPGSGDYGVADTLQPGFGYWVKAAEPGRLILSSAQPALPSSSNRIRIVPDSDEPPAAPPSNTIGVGPPPFSVAPGEYFLGQNFPNPFNPTTSIRFNLPRAGHVSLKVYNILGEVVATLVIGFTEAGFNDLHWDASGLPSGLYYYTLDAGDFRASRKMLMIR